MAEERVFGNVRLDRLEESARRVQADPSAGLLQVEMEGAWRFEEGAPQYGSVLSTPGGPVEVVADFPPPFGGWGKAPSAIQYCLYASTACFLSTYALVAAQEGVALRSLRVRLQARLNLQRFLGVGDAPVVESFRWTVLADTDADDATLERLRVLAEERCPATWCLRNPVPVESEVRRTA